MLVPIHLGALLIVLTRFMRRRRNRSTQDRLFPFLSETKSMIIWSRYYEEMDLATTEDGICT